MIVANLMLARSVNMVGAERVRSFKLVKPTSGTVTTASELNDDVIE